MPRMIPAPLSKVCHTIYAHGKSTIESRPTDGLDGLNVPLEERYGI